MMLILMSMIRFHRFLHVLLFFYKRGYDLVGDERARKGIILERNAYFDNAKVLLIFFVVFGHMIQPSINNSAGLHTLYMWIYTFHMPAFIFLAGFFAKGSGDLKYIKNLVKKLLIPYLIFQLLYTGYYLWLGESGWQGIFYPRWSLWFLISLFSWHILLIVFKKMQVVISLSVAIGIGLIVGYYGEIGHSFSLSRTFVFFPFFLVGYWCTTAQVMWLKKRTAKVLSIAILGIVAVAIYIAPDFNSGWLLASKSYNDLDLPEYGGAARFLVYVTSTLMAMSVLAWVPQKESWLTPLGMRTLYVYLLHGFFIQLFRQKEWFHVNHIGDLIVVAVVSVAIVLLLSDKRVITIWQPIIEGRMTKLKGFFSRREQQQKFE